MRYFALLLIIFFAALANADVLTLKNGKSVAGSILSMDTNEVRVTHCTRVEVYLRADVASIRMTAPAREDCSVPPPKGDLEFSSGVGIRARLLDFVDSNREPLGQSFRATVLAPVAIAGNTVIPKGAGLLIKLISTDDGWQALDLTDIKLGPNAWAEFRARSTAQALWTVGVVSDERKVAVNEDREPIIVRGRRVYVPSRTVLTFALMTPMRIALKSHMR